MRSHNTPAICFAQLNCIDRFRHGADLIDLQQKSIACLFIECGLDAGHIGHGEVVPHHLCRRANLVSEHAPSSPIVLIKRVLDRDDREIVAEIYIKLSQLCTCLLQRWVGSLGFWVPQSEIIAILALHFELRSGNVHANLTLAIIASFLDSLHDK